MPFRIVSDPQVSRALPEAGSDFGVSFELAAIGDDAHVSVTYSILEEQPYVFVPPTSPSEPKVMGPEPHLVVMAGTPIRRRIKVAKEPPGAPRVEQLFIEIEVTEVDGTGHPLTLPGGLVVPPRHLSAVVTII